MLPYTFGPDALGKRTLQQLVEMKDQMGKQFVRDSFHLNGLENVPVTVTDRTPKATFFRSRNRGGYYVQHDIHVMELDDGSFLYHYPYSKIQKLNTVTWTGFGNAELLIPSNVKKVIVLHIHRKTNVKASPTDFRFDVSVYTNVNYRNKL